MKKLLATTEGEEERCQHKVQGHLPKLHYKSDRKMDYFLTMAEASHTTAVLVGVVLIKAVSKEALLRKKLSITNSCC